MNMEDLELQFFADLKISGRLPTGVVDGERVDIPVPVCVRQVMNLMVLTARLFPLVFLVSGFRCVGSSWVVVK